MSERQGSAEPEEVPLPPIGSARGRAPAAAKRPTYTQRKPPDQQPWSLIGLGALASVVGALLLMVDSPLLVFVGFALLGLGSVLVAIGTIAEGIRLGARWVAHDRGE
jgi:hypothetical protein